MTPDCDNKVCKSQAWLKSGRLALFHLLTNLKTQTRDRHILLPAYHCRSIVDACTWAGFEPVLYDVNQDLSPNLEHVEKCLSADTAAAMLIHYFGFPNVSEEFVRLCRDCSVPIIEDACHVDFTNGHFGKHIGHTGEWIFSSPRKFYDIYDGGFLAYRGSMKKILGPKSRFPRLSDEARAVKHQFERSLLRLGKILHGTPQNPLLADTPDASSSQPYDEESENSYRDPRFTLSSHDAMTYASRFFLSMPGSNASARRRRRNYKYLLKLLTPARRCELLYDVLPDDVTPYVCPVILTEPKIDHPKLRSYGINVLRWEDLVASSCKTSSRYEEHLIQLPLTWPAESSECMQMTDVLTDVLS